MYYQDEQGKRGLRMQFQLRGLRRQANAELDAREVLYEIFCQFIYE